ncbi:MAG: porin, partial [Methylophilaceae bacterium]|nr:porin [Methylophilaceae bacterium]
MNKKLGLAVAGAVLALSSAAQAGITIPAGDWTVDIGGNVNAFYINNKSNDDHNIEGGLANRQQDGSDRSSSINTGLLPSWLTVGAKTRQNNLDVAWAISFQPGASSKTSLGLGGGSEFRQAYFTFGDASWGTVKIGKDLGVFGSDAILSDMTLLGVGSQGAVGQAGGTTTTLGRIGTGYMYADFNGQINYTSPNFNGFKFTVGIDQPLNTLNLSTESQDSNGQAQQAPAFVGLASYSWAGDFSGKIWAEAKTQRVELDYSGRKTANVFGMGANANVGLVGLTGYYYSGKGAGTTAFLMDGYAANGNRRDSDGYYLQATYVIPTGTKLGLSYGESKLD